MDLQVDDLPLEPLLVYFYTQQETIWYGKHRGETPRRSVLHPTRVPTKRTSKLRDKWGEPNL